MNSKAWIGVDLDGTLAHYEGWIAADHIGEPVYLMVERVKHWLAKGKNVKIFTARVSDPDDAVIAIPAIEAWCETHLGQVLEVTNAKDYLMVQLWDDRCIQVVHNRGMPVGAQEV